MFNRILCLFGVKRFNVDDKVWCGDCETVVNIDEIKIDRFGKRKYYHKVGYYYDIRDCKTRRLRHAKRSEIAMWDMLRKFEYALKCHQDTVARNGKLIRHIVNSVDGIQFNKTPDDEELIIVRGFMSDYNKSVRIERGGE